MPIVSTPRRTGGKSAALGSLPSPGAVAVTQRTRLGSENNKRPGASPGAVIVRARHALPLPASIRFYFLRERAGHDSRDRLHGRRRRCEALRRLDLDVVVT